MKTNPFRVFLTVVVCLLFSPGAYIPPGDLFIGYNGTVTFWSDAPLESIKARSEKLTGAINFIDRSFAFSVPVKSFQGFNSPLQRIHFNENYMESDKFPVARFTGRIIEDIDFNEKGARVIRAKGMLDLHGIVQERIIRSDLITGEEVVKIRSAFSVPLCDHNINIPKLVFKKIAEEILVEVDLELKPRP